MQAKNLNKVLFVGTGGGNDIFSTLLAKLSLWEDGWRWNECDIAGVLSPFHRHTCVETKLTGVYKIDATDERFVPRKDKEIKIGFVDAAVAKMVAEDKSLGIGNVYGLSLKSGTVGLAKTFVELSKNYDYIVLVDVGGDIFYRGVVDTHILSPMFDAIVLRAFVDSRAPGILFEAGPGTDGEMNPEALEAAFFKSEAEVNQLSVGALSEYSVLYEKWIAGTRQGRTVPVTIQAFHSMEPELVLKYRARAHIGKERFYKNFEHRINTSLCRKYFLVDPTKIANPFAVKCTSILDWFMKTEVVQHRTNCEANMEYLEIDGLLYQFLTPSPLLASHAQIALLMYGIFDIIHLKTCDRLLLFREDWRSVPDNQDFDLEIVAGDQLLTLVVKANRTTDS